MVAVDGIRMREGGMGGYTVIVTVAGVNLMFHSTEMEFLPCQYTR